MPKAKAKPQFIIKTTDSGQFSFGLIALNGEKILTASETYTTKAACQKGIQSVIDNAPLCVKQKKFLDLTKKNPDKVTNPRFEIFKDKKDLFRFRLLATNGENIGGCEKGYTTKVNCVKGCQSLAKDCKKAEIIDC